MRPGTIFATFLLVTGALATPPARAEMAAREGWVVTETKHDFATLAARVEKAAAAHDLGVVSTASASAGAKRALGRDIAGNMVLGLFHPRFAVRLLAASLAAGIEAPIRVYVTENGDGTATLSYKTPSFVLAPYSDEGGEALKSLAGELDALFDRLAREAAGG